MGLLSGKTVLVTGAGRGIGRAIAERFAAEGATLFLAVRHLEQGQALAAELQATHQITCHAFSCDVADADAVKMLFRELFSHSKTLDVLVNNAGLALGLEPADKADFADWLTMINTNIIGLTYLTRKILPGMDVRGRGHVINLGSVAGTYPYPGGNVYGATKAYVKQFSLNLRADLVGKPIRVTNVEPGLCGGTEFSNVRFKGDDDKAAKVYEKVQYLTAEDIANTIVWVAEQPAHMNVNSIEIMPVAQAFSPFNVAREA